MVVRICSRKGLVLPSNLLSIIPLIILKQGCPTCSSWGLHPVQATRVQAKCHSPRWAAPFPTPLCMWTFPLPCHCPWAVLPTPVFHHMQAVPPTISLHGVVGGSPNHACTWEASHPPQLTSRRLKYTARSGALLPSGAGVGNRSWQNSPEPLTAAVARVMGRDGWVGAQKWWADAEFNTSQTM